ncbi:alpha/beta fold hydrolase [Nocardia rhamnosiphila]
MHSATNVSGGRGHRSETSGGSGSGGGPPGPEMRGGEGHPGDFFVTLPNGSRLQCRAEGPEGGTPIIQIHGTPGSRVDTAPAELLDRLDVRLITYDRAGYGGSDLQPGARVADSAEHVRAIADHLGIGEFAVVGRSGGTPHAAAVAAGLPDRVTRLALLVPLAPPDLMKNDYFTGMTQQAGLDPSAEETGTKMAQILGACDGKIANFRADPTDPTTIIGIPRDKLGAADRETVDRNAEHLCAMYAEALAENGTEAWKEDLRTSMSRPWGFDFGDIDCPTMIWTASGDGLTPSAHAHKIAEQLPSGRARLYQVPGADVGHLGAMEIKPGAYAWLSGQEDMALFPTASASSDHPPGAAIPTRLDQWTKLAEPGAG